MKLPNRILALCLALLLCLGWTGGIPSAAAAEEEPTRYVVKLTEDGVMPLSLGADEDLAPIPFAEGYYTVEGRQALQAMMDAGLVAYAVPDTQLELLSSPLTNDPGLSLQWYVESLGISDAWEEGLTGSGVTVAVIDSGIYADHEDLDARKLSAKSRNFLGGAEGDPDAVADDGGHGTLVAGILAAQADNEIGIAGLSDGVELMTLRCFSANASASQNAGSGTVSVILSAIGYAMEQDVDVINLSFGGSNATLLRPLEEKLQAAADQGILLVAAVGNDGVTTLLYPAAFDCVIGVGNTNSNGVINSGSQHNSSVYISAPGTAIYGLGFQAGVLYRSDSGTSFSSPMVAAMGALVKQADPGIGQEGFMTLLKACAIDAGAVGYDTYYGHGIVSVSNLIRELKKDRSIHYELRGGTLAGEGGVDWPDSYTILRRAQVRLPQNPTWADHAFTGWYLDSACAGAPITEVPSGSVGELTVYAGWEDALVIDTQVEGITVLGITATTDNGSDYRAQLPYGTNLADLAAGDIVITPKDSRASLEGPTTADNGASWSFALEGAAYTLALTVAPMTVPVRSPDYENRTGSATPAAYDGETAAVPYGADMSEWFTSQGTVTYHVTVEEGAGSAQVSGAALTYTPLIADTGKTVELSVKASNIGGESVAAVAIALSIGAIPVSNTAISPNSAAYDKYQQTTGIVIDMNLYGNHLTAIQKGSSPLTAGADYVLEEGSGIEGDSRKCTLQHSYLKGLSVGSHTLIFAFSGGRTEAAKSVALTLTISDSTPKVTPSTGGAGGGAVSTTPELILLKDSNVKLSYTLDKSNTAVLTVDQAQLKQLAGSGAMAKIDLSGISGCVGFSIAESDLSLLKEAGARFLLPDVGIVLEGAALEDLLTQAKGKRIVFTASVSAPPSGLGGDSGGKLLELKLTAGGADVETLKGSATLLVPVSLGRGEPSAGIGISVLQGGAYAPLTVLWNQAEGMASARITQMGQYLVGDTAVWENPFSDVAEGDWFYEPVKFALDRGLFTGEEEGRFLPGGGMTRAMLVTVLYRMEGAQWQGTQSSFADVPMGAWYAAAVNWGAEEGIVLGTEAGFKGDDSLTREQLAAILYRYTGGTTQGDLSGFADGGEVSSWAAEAVKWAVGRGLLQGREDGRLDPGGVTTRAEVAAIFQRLLEE